MKRYLENIKAKHFSQLHGKVLFSGLSDSEIYTFVQRAKPYYISLQAGQTVTLDKSYSYMISIVLSGDVLISSTNIEGNKTLIKTLAEGESSGSLYSVLDYRNELVELEGREKSEVILIDPDSLFVTDEKIAVIQQKMLVNLINSQREMFDNLSKRMYCLTQRSIKDKIIKYLGFCSEQAHSKKFDIPHSREDLAGYLAVDRASLSRSLGELKREKIIDFNKNHFIILNENCFK